jgi:2,5-diketo-D-gluconate reductase B
MNNDMEKQKQLNIDNDRIPLLGLGTWNLNGEECVSTVALALQMGYRHLDTAQMYGNEKEVGKGIRQSGVDRDEVFVTTKVSTGNMDPDAIMTSTKGSLHRLDTAYIDLLLIHWPTLHMDLESCLSAMFYLRDEGKVKHVGVSNFNPDLFRRSMKLGPVICNQVEFSPYHEQAKNLQVAGDTGTMITAYSPLAKGRVSRDHRLTEIGEAYNKTAAQVSLRWLLQQGNVAVIPKSSGEKHLEENLRVFDFELSPEDMEKISGLA